MWLFLETTRPDAYTIGLLGGTKPRTWSKQGRSHEVLNQLARRVALQKIDGVCIVSGPGSFTSTRTGVLIANLLSRLFRVPLIGVPLDTASDLFQLTEKLQNGDYLPQGYVAPVYSSEPNITCPARS